MIFFAKIHPLLVHFPVGLWVTGSLFEIYGRLRNEPAVAAAGGFNVRLGLACALPVIAVGLLGVGALDFKAEAKPFLSGHIQYVLLTTFIFLSAVLLWKKFNRFAWVRGAYLLLLFAGLLSVLTAGYYGGEMVHRFGIAVS